MVVKEEDVKEEEEGLIGRTSIQKYEKTR